jgi:cell division protein FtsA
VAYEIQLSGFERQLIAGVVLTGGGARMKNIKELCEFTTGIDSRLGTPDEHLDKQGSVTFEDFSHPMYATGIGLVIYGLLETEQAAKNSTAQEAETPEMEKPEEPEEPKTSEVEESKIKRSQKPKRPFGKVVSDFLNNIFTEDGLNE